MENMQNLQELQVKLKFTQYEEIIARQSAEIFKIKSDLQTIQAKKASRLEDSLYSPNLYEHYKRVAADLSKSELVPNIYKNKPEDIFVAMAMGYQLGFSIEQSLLDIAVVSGRPALWGDGLMALVLNHPDCEGIDENLLEKDGQIIGYSCTVRRKGHQPHTQQFTLQDAQQAGLLKKAGAWQTYPKRMLQMRARSLALRDKFADALRGLRIAEIEKEDADFIEGTYDKEESPSQIKNLKNFINPVTTADHCNNLELSEKEAPQLELIIDKICILMEEKNFDEERKNKAFEYYKITDLSELDIDKAALFLKQLEKM